MTSGARPPLLPGVPGRMHGGPMARRVEALMRRDLARSFHHIAWHGPLPTPENGVPDDRPVVLLANHRLFHDGYLASLLGERLLRRRVLVWMREWDDFPLFAPVGALPFPDDDAAARGRTIRFTARRFEAPGYALLYFPEGELLPFDAPVRPFDGRFLERIDRLLPDKTWLPLAFHATFEGHARPVVKIGAGPPRASLRGDEQAAMQAAWDALRAPSDPTAVLMGGAASPNERWNFRFARTFFRRYL